MVQFIKTSLLDSKQKDTKDISRKKDIIKRNLII